MPSPAAPVIDAQQAAFLQQGVSITACSCNADKVTSIARVFGCKLSSDLRHITLYLSRIQAAAILADVKANGAIAVVFSEPPTHRTIQLKGKDARITDPDDDAWTIVEKHNEEFAQSLLPIGFTREFTHALLACPESELIGISFSPDAAFSQTPGPKAGENLRPGT